MIMRALDIYLRQQAANDVERADNPLPPIPASDCKT